jgi:hypothetical protein
VCRFPSHFRAVWHGLLLCVGLLAASCSGSGSLYPVEGQVLYKGEPIEKAVVTFHPKGATGVDTQRPSGVTGKDGVFKLGTGTKNGAPAGEYVVTVVWLKEVEPPKGAKKIISTEGPPDAIDQFKGRYAEPARSTLKATVGKSSTKLEPFRLD